MSQSTERIEILRLIESGKISTSEGLKLLSSLEPAPRLHANLGGRQLHIRVTHLTTQAPRVNVKLPLGLVSSGLRLGQRFVPELNEVGLDSLLEEIERGGYGKLVEVEDQVGNERVEVFVE